MHSIEHWRPYVARVWAIESGTKRYLGTAFLLGPRHLLTAKHLLDGWLDDQQQLRAGVEIAVTGQAWSGQRVVSEWRLHPQRVRHC